MVDLLTKLGFSMTFVIAIVIVTTIIWRVFNYKLEIEKQRFLSEINLIQSIHKDRFESIEKIEHYLSELFHNLNNLSDQPERLTQIEKFCTLLRSLVREKILILGEEIQESVYSITNYAKSVVDNNVEYNENYYLRLLGDVHQLTKVILKSIPRLNNNIVKSR